MKSKKLLTLALACAVTGASLLSACSTSEKVAFTANWYYDTTTKALLQGEETLKYAVTFQKGAGLYDNAYAADYLGGTYETKLTVVELNGESVYEYTTKLEMQVAFTHKATGEVSETFTDEVIGVSHFKSALDGLTPIDSLKTMHCHSPNGAEAATLKDCYTEYKYDVKTTYVNKKGTSVITDYIGNVISKKASEEKAESKSSFKASHEDYSYLDNEQLLFALRGLPAAAAKVSVYSPYTSGKQTISIKTDKKAGLETDILLNGEQKKINVNYYPFSLTISASNPGNTQTVWIAETSNTLQNTYRNVILKMSMPVSYNIGTIVYTLTEATFAE